MTVRVSRGVRVTACAVAAVATVAILASGCRDGPADKTSGENSRYGSQTATPSNHRT